MDKSLTYFANGQHDWDHNDTLLAIYLFKVMEANSTITDNKMSVDFSDTERQLEQEIGIDLSYLAENIIGCSVDALKINANVIDHFITGREDGFTHGNKFQIELSEIHKDSTVSDMLDIVEDIITNIENDSERISQNKIAKDLRENVLKENKRKREKKSQEKIKQDELKKDLEKKNVKNAKSISDVEDIEIALNTIINHATFGKGIVIETNSKISSVDFNGLIKKLANSFLVKIAE